MLNWVQITVRCVCCLLNLVFPWVEIYLFGPLGSGTNMGLRSGVHKDAFSDSWN